METEMDALRQKNTAYIRMGALRKNYRTARALARQAAGQEKIVISVVKADGYGHGGKAVVQALGDEGCRFFAVSSETEALSVRAWEEQRGRKPEILILGYTFPQNVPCLAQAGITCAAVSPAHAAALAAAVTDTPLRIHIKLDTGMNRVGFAAYTEEDRAETARQAAVIVRAGKLRLCGVFTHFSVCDDELLDGVYPTDVAGGLTRLQFSRYQMALAAMRAAGVEPGLRHCANSAALWAYPEAVTETDAVRAGIVLYGIRPDGRAPSSPWQPVMRMETTVGHIHTLLPGEAVSYGAAYRAPRDRKRVLATLTVGYADGFLRAYTGASVRIHGYSYPIVGRICMDQCMADITEHAQSVQVGDRAVLFGGDDGSSLAALAARAHTIPYECVCCISPRVPRVPEE